MGKLQDIVLNLEDSKFLYELSNIEYHWKDTLYYWVDINGQREVVQGKDEHSDYIPAPTREELFNRLPIIPSPKPRYTHHPKEIVQLFLGRYGKAWLVGYESIHRTRWKCRSGPTLVDALFNAIKGMGVHELLPTP